MKKLVLVLMMVVIAASLAIAAGQGEKTWKVGHVRPQGTTTDIDLVAFTDAVSQNTGGQITIGVYPASQLGNYDVVQERVGMGDIEMQLAPAANTVTKALAVTATPYLVTNWEEAEAMFPWDGDLMNAVEKMFDKENIKVLAQDPKYFGGIALAKKPANPQDPYASQKLKIRVPGIKSYELTATALGYMATPIPFSEAFTAMQTGIVDGVIGSGAEGYWSSFRDLTKYYLPLNTQFEMWFLYVNKNTWEKLSVEEQTAIQKAARDMEAARWKAAPGETKSYEENLVSIGAEIIPFTDAELNIIAEKVRAEVWPRIKDEYGAELFDSLTK